MNENIVILEQLPIISERLAPIKQEILDKTNAALKLDCTISNYKDVKKIRAELKKEFELFENKRKEIKTQILEPYEKFENIYKENISSIYKETDKQLKDKIKVVEDTLLLEKKAEVKTYFLEYSKALNLDICFEKVNLKLNMSTSISKLKEQCNDFLNKVVDDFNLINSQEYSDEIRVEYKSILNIHEAIANVYARKKSLGLEVISQIQIDEKLSIEQKAISKVDEVLALQVPIVKESMELEGQSFIATFEVISTLDKLKELKEFLNNGGYQYESIQ